MDDRGIIKSTNREKKRRKARYGMRVSGRSLISTILPAIAKKARNAKNEQEAAAQEKKAQQ